MSAVSPAVAAASQHAAVEVALVLLERMGLSTPASTSNRPRPVTAALVAPGD